jgi:hypothetical protein
LLGGVVGKFEEGMIFLVPANQKHRTYVDGINMFYILHTTVRTGTLESRQIVDKYVPRRDAVRILRKTD